MATGMTVYVMSFRDEVSDVTIEELEMKNNTYVYANDSNGELVCLYKVNNHTERIPLPSTRFRSTSRMRLYLPKMNAFTRTMVSIIEEPSTLS